MNTNPKRVCCGEKSESKASSQSWASKRDNQKAALPTPEGKHWSKRRENRRRLEIWKKLCIVKGGEGVRTSPKTTRKEKER